MKAIVHEESLERTLTVLLELMNSFTWDQFYFTEEGADLFLRLCGKPETKKPYEAFDADLEEIDPEDPDVRRRFLKELGIAERGLTSGDITAS